MGIRDKFNMFSERQAIPGNSISDNVIDLGGEQKDGSDRTVKIKITEAFNNLTSLEVTLQTSEVEAMTGVQHDVSRVVPLADLGLGDSFELRVPANCLRFAELVYLVTGTDPTAGTVEAGIGLDGIHTNK